MVPLAAIGIVKDKPLAPDERLKKIMTEVADGSTMLRFAATSPRVSRSELDPHRSRQRLVHSAAAVQRARTVIYEGAPAEQDRIGSVTCRLRTEVALIF